MFPEAIILVVKGDSDEADSVARLLDDHYRVIGAEEPEDALSHVNDPVELVISDLDATKPHGLDLLRAWKARQPSTPFLVLSGGDHVEPVVEAMKLGAADCLVKPINPANLRGLVSRLVDSRRAHRSQADDRSATADDKAQIDIPPGTSLEDLERAAVEQALAQHRGNRTHAAKTLGISVRTLQRKLKAWGIPMTSHPSSAGNNSFPLRTEQGSPRSFSAPAHSH